MKVDREALAGILSCIVFAIAVPALIVLLIACVLFIGITYG